VAYRQQTVLPPRDRIGDCRACDRDGRIAHSRAQLRPEAAARRLLLLKHFYAPKELATVRTGWLEKRANRPFSALNAAPLTAWRWPSMPLVKRCGSGSSVQPTCACCPMPSCCGICAQSLRQCPPPCPSVSEWRVPAAKPI